MFDYNSEYLEISFYTSTFLSFCYFFVYNDVFEPFETTLDNLGTENNIALG